MSAPLRRQAPQSKPLSIRFTEAEKTRLLELAGKQPLGVFIREKILGDQVRLRRARSQPSADAALLGRLLAQLGQSRLANNLNQLAKAANLGALPVTQETEEDLRQACAEISEIRHLLLCALGVKAFELASKAPAGLTERFNGPAQGSGLP